MQEYHIKVQRGPVKDSENTWQIVKRYTDFANLNAQLTQTQIDLPLPPKKVFGNFDRDFILARQNGLQVIDVYAVHCYEYDEPQRRK